MGNGAVEIYLCIFRRLNNKNNVIITCQGLSGVEPTVSCTRGATLPITPRRTLIFYDYSS